MGYQLLQHEFLLSSNLVLQIDLTILTPINTIQAYIKLFTEVHVSHCVLPTEICAVVYQK